MGQLKLLKSNKGQTSFEMLLVAVLSIGIAIFVLGSYIEFGDATTALTIMKAEVLEKLQDKEEVYVIQKIDFSEAGNTITFNITTKPSDIVAGDLDLSEAVNRIKKRTKYDSVIININA